MIYAVIPAAGRSHRMGQPKLTLPLAGSTVLGLVLDTLRRAGIEQTTVVIHPDADEVAVIAASSGAEMCRLAIETLEMRATVEAGLRQIEARYHPSKNDAWMLIPADHPTLDESIVRRITAARLEHVDFSIWLPTFHGRRGHPALIAWKHALELRAFPANRGINEYLRERPQEIFELAVDSETVLADLDVPEDYEKLVAQLGN